jgi:hypothetical protein
MENIAVIAVVAAIAFALWSAFRRRGGAHAEVRLRRICLGDEMQMERLITNEMTRAPGISRAEAINRAVERYQRDNR